MVRGQGRRHLSRDQISVEIGIDSYVIRKTLDTNSALSALLLLYHCYYHSSHANRIFKEAELRHQKNKSSTMPSIFVASSSVYTVCPFSHKMKINPPQLIDPSDVSSLARFLIAIKRKISISAPSWFGLHRDDANARNDEASCFAKSWTHE